MTILVAYLSVAKESGCTFLQLNILIVVSCQIFIPPITICDFVVMFSVLELTQIRPAVANPRHVFT